MTTFCFFSSHPPTIVVHFMCILTAFGYKNTLDLAPQNRSKRVTSRSENQKLPLPRKICDFLTSKRRALVGSEEGQSLPPAQTPPRWGRGTLRQGLIFLKNFRARTPPLPSPPRLPPSPSPPHLSPLLPSPPFLRSRTP